MRIGVTLEEKVKSTLKDAAKKLTGPKKRSASQSCKTGMHSMEWGFIIKYIGK
jgi:hypothetical protein